MNIDIIFKIGYGWLCNDKMRNTYIVQSHVSNYFGGTDNVINSAYKAGKDNRIKKEIVIVGMVLVGLTAYIFKEKVWIEEIYS